MGAATTVSRLLASLCLLGCSADIADPDGGGGQDAGSGAGGAGGESCDLFETSPVASPVRVRFVNETDEVLWLGFELSACDGAYPLEVVDGDVTLAQGLPPCGTCQNPGCFFGCIVQTPVPIEPGAFHDETWSGIVIRPDFVLPEVCRGPNGTVACALEERAAEPLLLRGSLHTERVDATRVGGQRLDVDVTWSPGQTEIELVFH